MEKVLGAVTVLLARLLYICWLNISSISSYRTSSYQPWTRERYQQTPSGFKLVLLKTRLRNLRALIETLIGLYKRTLSSEVRGGEIQI